jgi:hypothetical protein
MQNQLPLFLSYEQVHELPIVSKYEKIFDELDLSDIPEFNFGVGANGVSQHALLRAFVIRSLESLNTVSALIRFLQANPALICLCGFQNQRIPHDSQFYRFLNANTIDYLALALVALVAVRIKRPEKIRCFRTFLNAA